MKKIISLLLAAILLCMMCAGVIAEGTGLVSQELPVDLSPGKPPRADGYVGEWEYKDPSIEVKIETGRVNDCDYWVADIKIGHPSQLRTAPADTFESDMVMPALVIADRMNAVLAINGDYFNYTGKGYVLRQGTLYRDRIDGKRDILLIDEDGDFHFMRKVPKGKAVTEIDGKKIINAFWFGPVLVENGEVNKDYNFDQMAFWDPCQRMAIAQVGPLHYKVICCGPPERGSTGMVMRDFAEFIKSLGIDNAYNLDGGNSAALMFNGRKVNDPDNPKARELADIVYFASSVGEE